MKNVSVVTNVSEPAAASAQMLPLKGDRGNVIEVDPEKCIACGACIDACEHDAREYVDDVDRFFEDLKEGSRRSPF